MFFSLDLYRIHLNNRFSFFSSGVSFLDYFLGVCFFFFGSNFLSAQSLLAPISSCLFVSISSDSKTNNEGLQYRCPGWICHAGVCRSISTRPLSEPRTQKDSYSHYYLKESRQPSHIYSRADGWRHFRSSAIICAHTPERQFEYCYGPGPSQNA